MDESKTKTFVTIGVVVIAAVALLLIAKPPVKKSPDTLQTTQSTQSTQSAQPEDATDTSNESTATNTTDVKEFTVTGTNFSFEPKEIKVKQGDKVRVVFKNLTGFHDWVVDEFNAKTKTINVDEQDSVEFIANVKGIFEYYCSVGQHRAMGMKGNLIVD